MPIQHEMNFCQIRSASLRQIVLPPEVDSGTVLHTIAADQSTIIRPLTRHAVFEPVPVASGGQQLARKIQPILPAMSPATAAAIVKLQLPVGVEQPATYDRAANEILHALRHSRRMTANNTR